MGLLGNATAVERGVGQCQKEPSQPPKSDLSTPPCVTTAGNSLLALPDRPDRLVPHPAPARTCLFPSHPLHSSLNSSAWISTFIFSMNVPPAFKENSPEPAARAGDKGCCWKLGHLCDCVGVQEDAKGQCPSNSGLTSSFLILLKNPKQHNICNVRGNALKSICV